VWTGCNLLKYVTLFSCDTFGFFVSWVRPFANCVVLDIVITHSLVQVYLQYGVQTITRQIHSAPLTSAYVTIILSLLMLTTACVFRAMSQSDLFHCHVRRFFADYGMPISVVASSGIAYWGRFNSSNPATLPVGGAFQAAGRREWLVKFWQLDAKWVAVAFPFGVALWVLFFFDHNVSVRV
jgi:boron transporter